MTPDASKLVRSDVTRYRELLDGDIDGVEYMDRVDKRVVQPLQDEIDEDRKSNGSQAH